ncbi:MAG: PHP domain-containing protein, partial [Turicibacter sp.]
MGFTQLQTRSAYSLLNSTIKIEALIQFAKDHQLDTLALVEETRLHSGIKFYKACVKANIKPIIGLSVNVKIEDVLDTWTLIAKNTEGYQALLKIST